MAKRKAANKKPDIFDQIESLLESLGALGVDTLDIERSIVASLPPQKIFVIPEARWDCPSCKAANTSSMHYDDDGENECRDCGLRVLLEQP